MRPDMPKPLALNRRDFVRMTAAAPGLFALGHARAADAPRIAALFSGKIDDNGFMQAGYEGLIRAGQKFGVATQFMADVPPQPEKLMDGLRALAAQKPALIIAHGGQNNAAAKTVAAEFPDLSFAVTQGGVTGPNLAGYEVLQEHSAFLAGMLAALMTKTGTVGHMSGIRVAPGLKGRAAYAHGVKHANPDVRLLTNFSGHQDDNALSKKVAQAMIAQKADIIFTMLNAGRTGAIEACRDAGISQIGNVGDWTARAPDVFIASAVADISMAMENAITDFVQNRFAAGKIMHIGVENPQAVRLAMAPRVPGDVRAKIAEAMQAIIAGTLRVETDWSGGEFPNPA